MALPETRGTLTMNRKGDFSVRVTGDRHCGVKNSRGAHALDVIPMKYELTVECTTSLDDRGFLFDQISIDNFFQGIKSTSLSCEQFAISCARKLWQVIHREHPDCKINEMKVKISPAPYAAAMEFCYNVARDGVPGQRRSAGLR